MKPTSVMFLALCASCMPAAPAQDPQELIRAEPPAIHRRADGAGPNAQNSGPVSITLTSACPRTTKLFFGNDPAFGSGRSTTLGGNSRESASVRIGDKIWLLDDRGKGVASVSVGAGMKEVHVTTECSSLTVR